MRTLEWRDERSSHETLARITLYGSRVDANGSFVDPFGVPIAENIYRARVASTGRGYLLLYSEYGSNSTYSQRYGDDAQPIGSKIDVGPGYAYSIATNGSGFLALMTDAADDRFSAVFIDAVGVRRGAIDLGKMRDPALLAAGLNYRIVDAKWACDGVNPCTVSMRLTSIDDSTHAVSEAILGPEITQWSRVNAIAASGRIFIASVSDGDPQKPPPVRTVTVLFTDFSGNVLVPARLIHSFPTTCYCGEARASLAWDGREILAGWPERRSSSASDSESRVIGVRFRTDGTQVDPQPFDITSLISSSFVTAAKPTGILLLSSEQRRSYRPYYFGPPDLFARAASSIADWRRSERRKQSWSPRRSSSTRTSPRRARARSSHGASSINRQRSVLHPSTSRLRPQHRL